jgi:hypothetical protein
VVSAPLIFVYFDCFFLAKKIRFNNTMKINGFEVSMRGFNTFPNFCDICFELLFNLLSFDIHLCFNFFYYYSLTNLLKKYASKYIFFFKKKKKKKKYLAYSRCQDGEIYNHYLRHKI